MTRDENRAVVRRAAKSALGAVALHFQTEAAIEKAARPDAITRAQDRAAAKLAVAQSIVRAALDRPLFPMSWTTELQRNAAGRAFFYVSRFVSRTSVEYVLDALGAPKCFRTEREAIVACREANEAAS